jgi:hypothetical protein
MCQEVVSHFFDIRMINHFGAAFLQLACIGRFVCEIVGDESDAMTKLPEKLDDLKHSN